VRRAATKVLSAAVETRPELLSSFYKTISPVLISRFSEREEIVRLEIWQTYTKLLHLTKVFGGEGFSTREGEESPTSLKRKRDVEGMDVDEAPLSSLRAQAPTIVKNIVKQLGTKDLSTRQVGFSLLRALVDVLGGGLESDIDSLLPRIEAAFSASETGVGSGRVTSLKLEVLAFVEAIFRTHSPATFEAQLNQFVALLVDAIADKSNKVASEGFVASSTLVRVLRPVSIDQVGSFSALSPTYASAIKQIYESTLKRLTSLGADQDVREQGIVCLGKLLVHAGDALAFDLSRSLTFLHEALKREVTRVVAVRTIGNISQSPVLRGNELEQWLQSLLPELVSFLRQNNRILRVDVLACLPHLLFRAGPSVDSDILDAVLGSVLPFLSDDDFHLMPMAVNIVRAAIAANPSVAESAAFQESVLPRIYSLVNSDAVQGAALQSLLAFFTTLVEVGADAREIADTLVASVSADKKSADVRADGTATVAKHNYATSAKLVGVVVEKSPKVVDSVAKKFVTKIQSSKTSSSVLTFSLLSLGEIGRLPWVKKILPFFCGILRPFLLLVNFPAVSRCSRRPWGTFRLRRTKYGALRPLLSATSPSETRRSFCRKSCRS
jgi:cullin-associated NEDD8-dissociated protein 1